MKRLCLVLLLFLAPRLYAQTTPWTGVVATSRAIDWSQAGVIGGIPSANWSQCVTSACQTVTTNGASSTAAQIEAAITSASGSSTYVLLPAGNYTLTQLSVSGVSNVVLRGAGANQTVLSFTSGDPSIDIIGNSTGSAVLVTPASGQAGAIPQGATSVILASVANLKVGTPIIFDQLASATDDGGVLVLGTDSSYTGPFTAPGNAGPYSIDGVSQGYRGTCSSGPSTCYLQDQMVFVTSCNGVTTAGSACSGTNVTVGFSPSIHMMNWSTTSSMSARWSASPTMYFGIEDLTVDDTNDPGADNIGFMYCSNCWVKGIRSIDGSGNGGAPGHVMWQWGANDSVVNSYFFLTQNHVTSSYGINCAGESNLRVENNIFHAIASPVITNGACNGMVVGYNYDINNYYTESSLYGQNFFGEHAGGIDTNLLEGNIANYVDGDNIHGTGNLESFFRNVLTGPLADCWSSGSAYATAVYGQCNNGVTPVEFLSYHRFYNVVGNVLGTTGVNTEYQLIQSYSNPQPYIYVLGGGDTVPADPNVQPTAMFWGNADSATGFGSPRFNCSEVPTALAGVQAPYSNPCPSSHTLPSSFYYASAPSWWPSGKPWPIIGPDVSGGNISICSSGTYVRSLVTSVSMCTGGTGATGMNGLAYSNPAMDCYLSLGGLPDGTGPVLSNFNESSCYGQTVSSNPPPPSPPTNLSATVN